MNKAEILPSEKLKKTDTLADRVTYILLTEIRENKFPAHSRLPSESVMAKRFGVSRTVIREAVSRLKAEGLVDTRQGSGTSVLEPNTATPFRLDAHTQDSLQAVLRVIELRRGVEAEMAALAAERRSAAQFARIKKAFNAIRKAERAGRDGVDEDLAFHTEISQACGNPLYTSLLSYLSLYLHTAIVVTRANEAQRDDFSRQVHEEHTAIMEAIFRKDPAAARAAALRHMEGAVSRLRAIDAASWTAPMDEAARRLNRMRE
ncbi:FadR family transcriptional regulator [Pusillimonas harenae]|uniref:FadR family transcriptional regulator n=1 Tax=Pollutimonas harenae TaxID=657015 RepID=A0A853GXA9_9BURK|nr:FCD domain-containing protein [Pollutimonas harenae]NYT85386.1 FadR family transcriptional regulator [Pollutimonas harenae]TEA70485.1 FadR family transcriptional regulator [Pollutimonas harenae]